MAENLGYGWTPCCEDTVRPSAGAWSGTWKPLPLPAVPYDACDKQAGRVSSLSLVAECAQDQ